MPVEYDSLTISRTWLRAASPTRRQLKHVIRQGVFMHHLQTPMRRLRKRQPHRDRRQAPHQGHVAAQSGWEFDSLSALWREVSTGTFSANEGSNRVDTAGRNGASILLEGRLAPGEARTYPIVIAWHFPNCYVQDGGTTAATHVPPHVLEGPLVAGLSKTEQRRRGGRSTHPSGATPAKWRSTWKRSTPRCANGP